MNFMGMKLSSNSYQLAMSFTMKLNVYESIESGCFNRFIAFFMIWYSWKQCYETLYRDWPQGCAVMHTAPVD